MLSKNYLVCLQNLKTHGASALSLRSEKATELHFPTLETRVATGMCSIYRSCQYCSEEALSTKTDKNSPWNNAPFILALTTFIWHNSNQSIQGLARGTIRCAVWKADKLASDSYKNYIMSSCIRKTSLADERFTAQWSKTDSPSCGSLCPTLVMNVCIQPFFK
jgi:hypothetical protein